MSRGAGGEIPQMIATWYELQVLRLMARGKSNLEISTALSIAEGRVKFHVKNILSKLGVGDRTQAMIVALKRGIITL